MELKVVESFDGGDLVIKANDLEGTDSVLNQPYMALFGGNVEQSTEDVSEDGQERKDFWGNSLLLNNSLNNQFNSYFERELQRVSLTSSGIAALEAAAKKDLEYMSELSKVTVNISLQSESRIKIQIHLQELEGLSDQIFVYLWSQTKLEQVE